MSIQSAKIKYDILKISEEARLAKIKDSSVINATIGAYYNENNEFKAFKTVKGIINSLDDVDYYSYATSDGGAPYESAVISWVFKNRRKNVLDETNVRAVSTPGGTGALFTSMIESLNPGDEILIPDLCWEPYLTMATLNSFVAKRFAMFNDDLSYNTAGFINACEEMIEKQDKIVAIINDPCNNPTGYTMTMDEFKIITDYINNVDVTVYIIYDIAYFDYSEDINEQLEKLVMLSRLNNKVVTFITFSASKSFCTYGMRLGSQLIMSKNKEVVDTLYKRSCVISRTHWSNVSKAGINMMVRLVNNPVFKEEFLKEQIINKTILLTRIKTFLKEASDINLKVYNSKGGFFLSVPCNNPPMVFEKLKERKIYVIPLQTSIRIAICSVSIRETVGLARKIKEVIAEVNQ